MPVYTSDSQGGEAVDQRAFYFRIAESASSTTEEAGARAMIRVIDRLEAEFLHTDVWLLTSHRRLVLMDAPAYDGGPWYVTVESIVGEEYALSYRIPDAVSPFSRKAQVQVTAVGIEEAIAYIRIAMRESGGWPTSTELDR